MKTGAIIGIVAIVVGGVSLILMSVSFVIAMVTIPSFAVFVAHTANTLLKLAVTCFCWFRTRQIRRAQPDDEPEAVDIEDNPITVRKMSEE